jgi:lysine 2,3-aminomutase
MAEPSMRTLSALQAAGLIDAEAERVLAPVAERYAVALTPTLAGLVDQSDPDDPIARQFIPTAAELDTTPEERADPIGDHAHEPVPGLVHRHADRVLLKLVHVCPVYCRFCFRREMVGPGGKAPLAGPGLARALDYIRQHKEIWEVILTGGDPFMISPKTAREVTCALEEIAHVKIIRWHTRVPIADPARVTEDFVDAIRSRRKATYIVLHVNHPRELSPQARAAIKKLAAAHLPLLSQSVLLMGVNDDTAVLARLMRDLVEINVKPYYLHQADLAPGTSHFRVPLGRAQTLMDELKAGVSGLCQPTFVIDLPGGYGKVRAESNRLTPSTDDQSVNIKDNAGNWHGYPLAERD